MNIWKIGIRNFQYRPVYTLLGLFVLLISIALLLGIQQMDTTFKNQLANNLGDIDMVVGAKGSPLQLVLASVMHLDNPTGNISYAEAQGIAKNPMVKRAVPISYGDNYKGYRIVGTTKDFEALYNAHLKEGRAMERPMEAILGNTVAKRFGLRPGDTFLSSHGLAEKGGHEHAEPLTVVGIYNTTHKILDRLIVTDLETIWDVHHHHGDGEGEETDEHHEEEGHGKEITSLLVSFRNPMALLTLPRNINENTDMQAALPKFELDRLYRFTGLGVKAITWIAYAILIISCLTIFISLYKMVKERAFDLALMRTYGASNWQLVKMVVYEGLLIGGLAFFLGAILSQIGVYIIFRAIEDEYKQQLPVLLTFKELWRTGVMVLSMVVFSVCMALYPIIKMNISKILSHEK